MKEKPDHISQSDWDDVDSPELTEKDFKRMRPASEVLPQVVSAYRKGRKVQNSPTKIPVSIRLSQEVVEYFHATGRDWQSRVDEVLREFVGSHR